ncbi:MAG: FemAB family PEP-CTERM system-associated protein [Candidatus Eiseniibacteriota bacterium]|jgi:FemAB-related protein (PEP-CTERM system-associated)
MTEVRAMCDAEAHSGAVPSPSAEQRVERLDAASPDAGRAWDTFVGSRPDACLAHAFGWGRTIERTYGRRAHDLVVWRQGTLAGVLPLVEVRSRLFGSSLTSMPYLDVAGPLATDDRARETLVQAACELARELGVATLDLRALGRPAFAGPSSRQKVTLVLELGDDVDTLWKAIGPKPRNQVRKAEKSGLTTRRSGAEGIAGFYRVYAINMRDLGSPPHRRGWFEAIFAQFGDAAACHLVELDGTVIGGLIAIDQGDTVTVPWASCERRHFRLCPNNLLYWETFRAAIERGQRRFDFGRSSRGSGTYRFKRQWGATETTLCWQVIDPRRVDAATLVARSPVHPGAHAAAGTPDAAGDGATAAADDGGGISTRRALAARLWQRLPVPVATWLGTRLRGGITL